jgi:hypothetical protein
MSASDKVKLDIAEQIYGKFLMDYRRWSVNGELKVPEPDDIVRVLDRAKEALYAEDQQDGATLLFSGGLVIKRQDPHLDVYVHFGDLNVPEAN